MKKSLFLAGIAIVCTNIQGMQNEDYLNNSSNLNYSLFQPQSNDGNATLNQSQELSSELFDFNQYNTIDVPEHSDRPQTNNNFFYTNQDSQLTQNDSKITSSNSTFLPVRDNNILTENELNIINQQTNLFSTPQLSNSDDLIYKNQPLLNEVTTPSNLMNVSPSPLDINKGNKATVSLNQMKSFNTMNRWIKPPKILSLSKEDESIFFKEIYNDLGISPEKAKFILNQFHNQEKELYKSCNSLYETKLKLYKRPVLPNNEINTITKSFNTQTVNLLRKLAKKYAVDLHSVDQLIYRHHLFTIIKNTSLTNNEAIIKTIACLFDKRQTTTNSFNWLQEKGFILKSKEESWVSLLIDGYKKINNKKDIFLSKVAYNLVSLGLSDKKITYILLSLYNNNKLINEENEAKKYLNIPLDDDLSREHLIAQQKNLTYYKYQDNYARILFGISPSVSPNNEPNEKPSDISPEVSKILEAYSQDKEKLHNETILKLYKLGFSALRIIDLLELPYNKAHHKPNALKKYQLIDLSAYKSKLNDNKIRKFAILSLYKQNLKIWQIADFLGITRNAVCKYIAEHGTNKRINLNRMNNYLTFASLPVSKHMNSDIINPYSICSITPMNSINHKQLTSNNIYPTFISQQISNPVDTNEINPLSTPNLNKLSMNINPINSITFNPLDISTVSSEASNPLAISLDDPSNTTNNQLLSNSEINPLSTPNLNKLSMNINPINSITSNPLDISTVSSEASNPLAISLNDPSNATNNQLLSNSEINPLSTPNLNQLSMNVNPINSITSNSLDVSTVSSEPSNMLATPLSHSLDTADNQPSISSYLDKMNYHLTWNASLPPHLNNEIHSFTGEDAKLIQDLFQSFSLVELCNLLENQKRTLLGQKQSLQNSAENSTVNSLSNIDNDLKLWSFEDL